MQNNIFFWYTVQNNTAHSLPHQAQICIDSSSYISIYISMISFSKCQLKPLNEKPQSVPTLNSKPLPQSVPCSLFFVLSLPSPRLLALTIVLHLWSHLLPSSRCTSACRPWPPTFGPPPSQQAAPLSSHHPARWSVFTSDNLRKAAGTRYIPTLKP